MPVAVTFPGPRTYILRVVDCYAPPCGGPVATFPCRVHRPFKRRAPSAYPRGQSSVRIALGDRFEAFDDPSLPATPPTHRREAGR